MSKLSFLILVQLLLESFILSGIMLYYNNIHYSILLTSVFLISLIIFIVKSILSYIVFYFIKKRLNHKSFFFYSILPILLISLFFLLIGQNKLAIEIIVSCICGCSLLVLLMVVFKISPAVNPAPTDMH